MMEVGDLPKEETTVEMNTFVVGCTWLLSVCFLIYLTTLFECISHKYRENAKLLTEKYVGVRDWVRFYCDTRALNIDIILFSSELSERMK
jgi:hypothetical protein